MALDFFDRRQQQARREVGRTQVTTGLASALAALFLLSAAVVPSLELARVDSGGPGLGAVISAAARAWRAGGPLAANGAALREMKALEDRLDEESVVARWALPAAQWLQTAVLGAGNQRAFLGRDGWLFFAPGVEYATGPPFLEDEVLARRREEGDAWAPPPSPDPRVALRAFADQLARRGIALIVVPTPGKATIEPELLSRAAPPSDAPLHNPSFGPLVAELEDAGIAVFDPGPVLVAAKRRSGRHQFLHSDSHWTPEAMTEVAEELSAFIRRRADLPASARLVYRRRPVDVEGSGDLAAMLRLPAWSGLFPRQRVVVRQVTTQDGKIWKPDPTADVLLLGDSFTNVYSLPALGWGEGAGLAEQLGFFLRRPVDRIAVNAGGAHAARERLQERLDAGEDRLAGKRIVIYQFAARELAVGDWKVLGSGASGAARRPQRGEDEDLGEGFVVWESNRTGAWRLWTRRLDGAGLRQLSAEEPGMVHCCPHISPDGRWVAYLSRPVGQERYPEVEVPGPLRLLATDGSQERTVVPEARSYGWGNRAVVWRSNEELVYVDGSGRSQLLNLIQGRSRLLTTEPREELGWLMNAPLTHATSAAPSFSLYDGEGRRVVEREVLEGCEPYFSHDGRWGFWVSGGGGPVRRMDLADRRVSTILNRDDPRMPTDRGYVYFAMVSRDGRYLALGASAGPHEHNHFTADYDIFVAPVDPRNLEIVGPAIRVTSHRATDRYPDVFPAPLELGWHGGEAPLRVTFRLPPGLAEEGHWELGDGAEQRGPTARHVYREPGFFEVEARAGGQVLRGEVRVDPARPPRVLAAQVEPDGRSIGVRFDEEVAVEEARLSLASGRTIASWEPGADRRSLVIRLPRELQGGDRLQLSGVMDRAQVPNLLPPTSVAVSPPPWPAERRGLAFLWEAADRPNLVLDPKLGKERAYPLTPRGRARLYRTGAMVLDGGSFVASKAAGEGLLAAVRSGWAVTIEATLTPAVAQMEGLASIVSFGDGPGRGNFTLAQQGRHLVLAISTGPEAARRPSVVPLMELEAGRTDHVVVTYSRGRLAAYRNGEEVLASGAVEGGFARWRPRRLVFGDEWTGGRDWPGTLEGIALYGRVLSPEEVGENSRRSAWLRQERQQEVPGLEVRARLVAKSTVPTLLLISPYRRALVVYEYEVDEVLVGSYTRQRLRAAHWAILDAQRQPIAAARPGESFHLTLEPFSAHPQLEAHYLSDTLEDRPGLPLFYCLKP